MIGVTSTTFLHQHVASERVCHTGTLQRFGQVCKLDTLVAYHPCAKRIACHWCLNDENNNQCCGVQMRGSTALLTCQAVAPQVWRHRPNTACSPAAALQAPAHPSGVSLCGCVTGGPGRGVLRRLCHTANPRVCGRRRSRRKRGQRKRGRAGAGPRSRTLAVALQLFILSTMDVQRRMCCSDACAGIRHAAHCGGEIHPCAAGKPLMLVVDHA